MDCAVAFVVQARPDVLRGFLARYPQPVPVVSDPDRVVYRDFGLERTGWWTFFRPMVLARYLRFWLTGQRIRKPYDGEDVRQLGGDFILSRDGEVLFAFRDPDPTRRPSVEELLRVLNPAG